MAITAAFIKMRFPGPFPASFSDDILNAAIAEAERANDATVWLGLYDDAIMYYACMVALVGPTFAAAIAAGVQSATAGPVSITFASGGGGAVDSVSAANGFGAMYASLNLRRGPAFLVV